MLEVIAVAMIIMTLLSLIPYGSQKSILLRRMKPLGSGASRRWYRLSDDPLELECIAGELVPVGPEHQTIERGYIALDEGDRKVKKSLGRMFFDPPRQMRVKDELVVTLRVTSGIPHVAVQTAMAADMRASDVQFRDLPVTAQAMAAELYSPATGAFDILSLSPMQQTLATDRGFAEWKWRLTALRRGLHSLAFRVSSYAHAGNQLVPCIDVPPFETAVTVRIHPQRIAGAVTIATGCFLGLLLANEYGKLAIDHVNEKLGLKQAGGETGKMTAPPPGM